MKETPVSNCEKAFLLEGLWESKRTDGRGMFEGRKLDIVFGKEFSSALARSASARPHRGPLALY